MHFTTRSAPMSLLAQTLPLLSAYLAAFRSFLSPALSSDSLPSTTRPAFLYAVGRAPVYRTPPTELISVISRSCNLSRLLHGQLIIIAIPISDDLDNSEALRGHPLWRSRSNLSTGKTDFRFASLPMGFLLLIRIRPCVGRHHYCPEPRVIFCRQRSPKCSAPGRAARLGTLLVYNCTPNTACHSDENFFSILIPHAFNAISHLGYYRLKMTIKRTFSETLEY